MKDMKKLLKKLIIFLNLKYEVTQYRFGRKLFGGEWFYTITWLPMTPFWANIIIKFCDGTVLKIEKYERKN